MKVCAFIILLNDYFPSFVLISLAKCGDNLLVYSEDCDRSVIGDALIRDLACNQFCNIVDGYICTPGNPIITSVSTCQGIDLRKKK